MLQNELNGPLGNYNATILPEKSMNRNTHRSTSQDCLERMALTTKKVFTAHARLPLWSRQSHRDSGIKNASPLNNQRRLPCTCVFLFVASFRTDGMWKDRRHSRSKISRNFVSRKKRFDEPSSSRGCFQYVTLTIEWVGRRVLWHAETVWWCNEKACGGNPTESLWIGYALASRLLKDDLLTSAEVSKVW